MGTNLHLPGDVNGDGFGDILLGEKEPSAGNPVPAGYIILGPTTSHDTVQVAADATYAIDPLFPSYAYPAGDPNADGISDLWVPGFDLNLYLFHGPIPAVLDVNQASASLAYNTYRNFTTGDVDGDGHVDALVQNTAWDGAYLVPGPLVGDLSVDAASFHLYATDCENVYAEDLGDTNGDGAHEVYVGVNSIGYCDSAPQVGIIMSGDYLGVGELEDVAAPLARLVGSARGARAAGDVNGDGFEDVVLLGPSPASGMAVVFGPFSGDLDASIDGDVRWTHPTAYPHHATSVGDLDGDGASELALVYYENQTMAFTLYIVPGGRTGTWDASVEWALSGGDRHVDGLQVSAGSDVDGDGVPDLLAGVPGDVAFVSLGVHY